jgi:hypothetical protein
MSLIHRDILEYRKGAAHAAKKIPRQKRLNKIGFLFPQQSKIFSFIFNKKGEKQMDLTDFLIDTNRSAFFEITQSREATFSLITFIATSIEKRFPDPEITSRRKSGWSSFSWTNPKGFITATVGKFPLDHQSYRRQKQGSWARIFFFISEKQCCLSSPYFKIGNPQGIQIDVNVFFTATTQIKAKAMILKYHKSFGAPKEMKQLSNWKFERWTLHWDATIELCREGAHKNASRQALRAFRRVWADVLSYSEIWQKLLFLASKVSNSSYKTYLSAFRMAAKHFYEDVWDRDQSEAILLLFKAAFHDKSITPFAMNTFLHRRMATYSYSAVASAMAALAYFGSMIEPLSFSMRWPGLSKSLMTIATKCDDELKGSPALDWDQIKYVWGKVKTFNWIDGFRTYKSMEMYYLFVIAFFACLRIGEVISILVSTRDYTDEGNLIRIKIPDTKCNSGKLITIMLTALEGKDWCPCKAFRILKANKGGSLLQASNGKDLTKDQLGELWRIFRAHLTEIPSYDRFRLTMHTWRISYIGYCAEVLGLELEQTRIQSRHASVNGAIQKVYAAKSRNRIREAQLSKYAATFQERSKKHAG